MSFPASRRAFLTALAALSAPAVHGHAQAVDQPPLQGRLVTVNGTRLWVEDYGPAEAPALLYVHGGPGLGVFEFSHFMRGRFGTSRRLILVDQRGVLRSDPLEEGQPMNLGVIAGDFEALRRTLGVPRWSLLAHSWGGPLALHYAVTHPDAVDRIVFENAVLDADSTARNVLEHAARALASEGRASDARMVLRLAARGTTRQLWDGMDDALNRLERRQRLYVYDPAFLGFYGRITRDSGIPDERWGQGVRMALTLLHDPEAMAPAWNRISRLDQPALFVRGETDPSTSEREFDALRRKPNVGVIEVAQAGHFVHVERPAAFAQAVESFLSA